MRKRVLAGVVVAVVLALAVVGALEVASSALEGVRSRVGAEAPWDARPALLDAEARWAASRIEQRDVVMLGDSMTDIPDWDELLGRTDVANRGLGGDRTHDLAHRLDSVLALDPRIVFVQVGYNDLAAGSAVEDVAQRTLAIVERLRAAGVAVVLQSVLHTGADHHDAEAWNRRVAEVNARLVEGAEGLEGVRYLDLNASLAPEGRLLHTVDAVHPAAEAYVRWAELVREVLAEEGLSSARGR
jgi:lysophospholipase L1-like esterase